MKKYEIMYILKPELDADQIKAANANLQKILESNGAKIEDVNGVSVILLTKSKKSVRVTMSS